MSSINIKRAVENIRSGTTVYTPAVELIVNAIQAIREIRQTGGVVTVTLLRSRQAGLLDEDRTPAIDGFIVEDDGIGFDDRNRNSFDELYSELKAGDGGKGFGRFTCLKYFRSFTVNSVFHDGSSLRQRQFVMGTKNDIIIQEKISETRAKHTGSTVTIEGIKSVKFPDKSVEVIARILVEKLLPYFIDPSFECPKILVRDADSISGIVLNDYLLSEKRQIVELSIDYGKIELQAVDPEIFSVRVFKFYAPRAAKSKVSLVAHRREVTDTAIQTFIPEFADEFYEPVPAGESGRGRNYIVKAYVFGAYLDRNVSLERGEFAFGRDSDLFHGLSQRQIEKEAADIAERAVGNEIVTRRERKQQVIRDYVETEAPWHRILSTQVDFSTLPMNPSGDEIEMHLQKAKLDLENRTRASVRHLLNDAKPDEMREMVADIVGSISESSKNDLAHYVSMRRCVLDILDRALEKDEHGHYRSEADVHDIIMPRRRDSEDLPFEQNNLWILDERLNFTTYISSDKPINGGNTDRTDIAIFNRRIAFRGDNEASNPIIIFEFKKPGRDDFANLSSKDDPVEQIIRYVNGILDGKYTTPPGREIRVTSNTTFFGYVVCDLTNKTRNWLFRTKNFNEMPDGEGYFKQYPNIHLYVEVISWDKALKDAVMRNKIFFKTLGI